MVRVVPGDERWGHFSMSRNRPGHPPYCGGSSGVERRAYISLVVGSNPTLRIYEVSRVERGPLGR